MMMSPELMWFLFGVFMGSLVTSILYTISNEKIKRRLNYIESLLPPQMTKNSVHVKVRGRDDRN